MSPLAWSVICGLVAGIVGLVCWIAKRELDRATLGIRDEEAARKLADSGIYKRIELEVGHRDGALGELERESLSMRTRVHELSNLVTMHDATLSGVRETMTETKEAVHELREAVHELRLLIASLQVQR